MIHQELLSVLTGIRRAKVGVLGDFCLDAYLMLDMAASEISLETGLATRPVRSQRYSLGGAGNVVNNLCAMSVGHVAVFGVIGADPYGKEMRDILVSQNINIDGLLVQRENWDTHVYMKPFESDQEQPRLDFGNFNKLYSGTGAKILDALAAQLPELDVIIINQQVMSGIHTDRFRGELSAFILKHPHTTFIVDSRHYADSYANAIRKLNVREAARLCGRNDIDWEMIESAGD